MGTYSTAQAARLLRVGRATLHRWMREGRVKAPRARRIGGVLVRIWTGRDVERVRKYKKGNYRKGRGRKPKRGQRASENRVSPSN